MTDNKLKSYSKNPSSGKDPKQIVIFLHGYGANGMDLLGLADEWSENMPDTVFVSPDAPFSCEISPSGYQWFSLQDRTEESVLEGVKLAHPLLDKFIEEQLAKYKLTSDKMVLVGFSQGTMMSLYAAPRNKTACAGVLGYSGALIDGAELDSLENISIMPVHLLHGDFDPIVPVEEYFEAKSQLKKCRFEVTGEVYGGLQHGINQEGVISGGEFLKKIFKL